MNTEFMTPQNLAEASALVRDDECKRLGVWNLNERELRDDMLFLETVQSVQNPGPVEEILRIAMDHFKFGYGGYNGSFRDREEMVSEIRAVIDSEIAIRK